jgi:mono/diheme cytochrome c family protein
VLLGATLWLAGGAGSAQAGPAAQADEALGERIYAERCAFCHGDQGDGNGPVADYLAPRPRDFTGAVFKLSSSANGTLPAEADLIGTVAEGIPGTAMPAWKDILTEEEIRAVAAYLKSFDAEDWADESIAAQPIQVGQPPRADEALIARGRELFAGQEAQCIKCHGQAGRGDGESAAGMTDDWDQPLYPANLTKGWRYKGGSDMQAIYTRLTSGVAGSPMPSYQDALPDDADRWALAAYVSSLARQLSDEAVLEAAAHDGPLPTTADDPAWAAAPQLLLPLSGQVVFPPRWQNPAIDAVGVQALYNEEDVAFRLVWDDRFHDTEDSGAAPALPAGTSTYVAPVAEHMTDHPAYSDKIELQFPAQLEGGVERPYFVYGSAAKPVSLWRWDSAGEEARELTQAGAQAAAAAQPEAGQQLAAAATYQDGQYQLVFSRPRRPADGQDIAFEAGVPIPFAIHAWDGSNGETSWVDEAGTARHLMAMSAWYHVVLKPETPATVFLWTLVAIVAVAGGEWWLARRLRRRA